MGDFPRGQILADKFGELQFAQYSFAGMNFLVDPADVTIESGQCVDLVNCDVDYAYNVSRRKGFKRIFEGIVHCLWQGTSYTYCVYNGILQKYDWSNSPMIPVLTINLNTISVTNNCEFKQVNDVVFYSDGVTCGVIQNTLASKFNATALPTEEELVAWVQVTYPNDYEQLTSNFEVDGFKRQIQPGSCLEYYNGVLYYAIDNFIYCSKAFDVETEDIRFSVVAGFPTNITMLGRVSDGLYVGTTNSIYFLDGTGNIHNEASGNLDKSFTQKQVSAYGVIKGSSVRLNATLVPDANAQDTVVLCASTIGIFALCNSGRYINLSAAQIAMPVGAKATALLKEDRNLYQYIVCYNVDDNVYGNLPYILDTTKCIDTIILNTVNLCHSRYVNFAFNSFIRNGSKYYASCMKGVYELIGDLDFDGELNNVKNIEGIILTPTSDFNERKLKQVSDGFVHGRSNGLMQLDIILNEGIEYRGFCIPFDNKQGIHRRRVKLPRGIQGTDYQFRIRNTNGCSFDVFDLEIYVKTEKRII